MYVGAELRREAPRTRYPQQEFRNQQPWLGISDGLLSDIKARDITYQPMEDALVEKKTITIDPQ